MKIDTNRCPDEETLTAVGQTVSILAHRVNNILQGINGGSHLVDTGFERNDPSIGQHGWEIVKRNQGLLASLFGELIDLGKPISLEPEPISLVRLADVIKTTLDSQSNENFTIQFESEIELNDRIINVDIEGVESIIQNLSTLAMDASEVCDQEPTSIKVSLGCQSSGNGSDVFLISFGYQGVSICTNVKDQRRFLSVPIDAKIGGIEFALSNKIANLHGGKVSLAARTQDGIQQRIEITLPFEC